MAWPVRDRCSSSLEWPAFSILDRLALQGAMAVRYLAGPQSQVRLHRAASGSAESEFSNPRSRLRLPDVVPTVGRHKPPSRAPHPFAVRSPLLTQKTARALVHISRHPELRVRCRTALPADRFVPDRDPVFLAPDPVSLAPCHASPARGHAVPGHDRFASRCYPRARPVPLQCFPVIARHFASRGHSHPPVALAAQTRPPQ